MNIRKVLATKIFVAMLLNCLAVPVSVASRRRRKGGPKDKKWLKEEKYKYKQEKEERVKDAKSAQAQSKMAKIAKELKANTKIAKVIKKFRISPKKLKKAQLKFLFAKLKRDMVLLKMHYPELFKGKMKKVEKFIDKNAEKGEFSEETITKMSLLSPIWQLARGTVSLCTNNPKLCFFGILFFLIVGLFAYDIEQMKKEINISGSFNTDYFNLLGRVDEVAREGVLYPNLKKEFLQDLKKLKRSATTPIEIAHYYDIVSKYSSPIKKRAGIKKNKIDDLIYTCWNMIHQVKRAGAHWYGSDVREDLLQNLADVAALYGDYDVVRKLQGFGVEPRVEVKETYHMDNPFYGFGR